MESTNYTAWHLEKSKIEFLPDDLLDDIYAVSKHLEESVTAFAILLLPEDALRLNGLVSTFFEENPLDESLWKLSRIVVGLTTIPVNKHRSVYEYFIENYEADDTPSQVVGGLYRHFKISLKRKDMVLRVEQWRQQAINLR